MTSGSDVRNPGRRHLDRYEGDGPRVGRDSAAGRATEQSRAERAAADAGRQASRQAGKQAGRQADRQAVRRRFNINAVAVSCHRRLAGAAANGDGGTDRPGVPCGRRSTPGRSHVEGRAVGG